MRAAQRRDGARASATELTEESCPEGSPWPNRIARSRSGIFPTHKFLAACETTSRTQCAPVSARSQPAQAVSSGASLERSETPKPASLGGLRLGWARAGEGNRTLVTSLEGWGSTVELRPRGSQRSEPFS